MFDTIFHIERNGVLTNLRHLGTESSENCVGRPTTCCALNKFPAEKQSIYTRLSET